nr:hypothetical protein [Microtetraspora fusca]
MTIDDQLGVLDDLLARPFPAEEERHGYGTSAPAYHVRALRLSQDFWDDGLEVVEAAAVEMEAALEALAARLTEGWGEPETIRLPQQDGELLAELSRTCGSVLRWRPRDGGRWVGLAIGQEDREFPIMLLAAAHRGERQGTPPTRDAPRASGTERTSTGGVRPGLRARPRHGKRSPGSHPAPGRTRPHRRSPPTRPPPQSPPRRPWCLRLS